MNNHAHEDLLGALRAAVNRDHVQRRRKTHSVVVVALLFVLLGGTVAAATTPWADRSKPEVSKAVILVRATLRYDNYRLAAGTKIAIWRTPDQAGGACLLFGSLDAGPPHRGSFLCESPGGQPVHSRTKLMMLGIPSILSHGVYDHFVFGFVDPTSGIVRVVLKRSTGSSTLAFSHGWFLGDTAPTTAVDVPNAYVVGYDRAGHEVTRVRAR